MLVLSYKPRNMGAQQVRDLIHPCVVCRFHSDENVARFVLEWQESSCRVCKILEVVNVIDNNKS